MVFQRSIGIDDALFWINRVIGIGDEDAGSIDQCFNHFSYDQDHQHRLSAIANWSYLHSNITATGGVCVEPGAHRSGIKSDVRPNRNKRRCQRLSSLATMKG